YHINPKTPALLLEDGVKVLRDRITVAVDQRTNVVRFDVEAPSAPAARDMAGLLLDQLVTFNLGSRQSIARNRRQFIEGRLTDAESDLRSAEDALRTFYERNRQWETSPQ